MSSINTLSRKQTAVASSASADVVHHDDSRLSNARTPSAHNHAQSDVTDLTTDLADKATAVFPIFAGRASTTQSLTNNTDAAVLLNVEDLDTHSGHSTVTDTSRWTCPTGWTGYYFVSGQVCFAANATGLRRVHLEVNGAVISGTHSILTATAVADGGVRATTSGLVHLDVGDFVELNAFQTSGGSLSTEVISTAAAILHLTWVRG